MARDLCFLALEKFCSKPGLVWNLINIKQKKRVGGGALIESGGLSSFGLASFAPEIPPKTQIFERAAGKPLERWK